MKSLSVFFVMLLCAAACKHDDSSQIESRLLDSCQSQISPANCNYYDCMESQYKCGGTGYPLAYGKFYCQKFQGFCANSLTSPNAQKWVVGTMQCLKNEIAAHQSDFKTCTEITQFAFDTHSSCYTNGSVANGGVSFCSLSPFDWTRVTTCISLGDQLSIRGLAQVAATAARCGKFFLFGGGLFLDSDGEDGEKPDPQTERQIKSMTPSERERRAKEFFDFSEQLKKKIHKS